MLTLKSATRVQSKLFNGLLDKITVLFIAFFLIVYVVGMVAGQSTNESIASSVEGITVPLLHTDASANSAAPAVEVPPAQPTESKQSTPKVEDEDDD